ncbi:hypothetical protein JVT61DRAFT_2199 [Boletus reticuloceps]|uniref:DUF3835 domain-containing protein n=1 Tax=Boletus reticuloceps TaxID=495285 RepID=A0A8I2YNJ0_9AGAM|nr:hypothetical protein JVT61DRAFT_2199 [Boletus reticuloceps]
MSLGNVLYSIADAQNQLLNEHGDPIIDISEPVNEYSQNITPSPVPKQDSIPFSLLPPDERERRRRERDRILDLLEEEERLQQLQEERDAEEEHKEAIRKRKESAKAELERLKGARELQKKIGKALVRHAEEAGKDRQGEDVRSKPQDTYPVAKKSVSFADASAMKADGEDEQTPMRQIDWGDVTPGRLRAQTRIPLVSAAEAEKYPMKMRVVERHPTTTATSPSHSGADSDDDSPSTGYLSPLAENNSSDEDKSSSTNNDLSGDEPLEGGFDYDAAQHHREIALEYHKKRHTIGAETAKAMAAQPPDDCDQHETLSGQLPLSHFRADRMAAAYDKSHGHVSTSIGHTVIPASRQKSTRNSVRLGKLEDDQLVGGDSGESGSEDEAIREVMHMLQAGNIQNAGPNFEPFSTPTVVAVQNPDATGSSAIQTSFATRGAKRSRFKLARGGGIADRGTFENDDSRDNTQLQPAISSVVERKAPRSSPSQRFPINRPLR